MRVLGKLYGGGPPEPLQLPLKLREIMRYALHKSRPFTPQEVCDLLGVKGQHARDLLQQLVQLELLAPDSGSTRIRTYKLGPRSARWFP